MRKFLLALLALLIAPALALAQVNETPGTTRTVNGSGAVACTVVMLTNGTTGCAQSVVTVNANGAATTTSGTVGSTAPTGASQQGGVDPTGALRAVRTDYVGNQAIVGATIMPEAARVSCTGATYLNGVITYTANGQSCTINAMNFASVAYTTGGGNVAFTSTGSTTLTSSGGLPVSNQNTVGAAAPTTVFSGANTTYYGNVRGGFVFLTASTFTTTQTVSVALMTFPQPDTVVFIGGGVVGGDRASGTAGGTNMLGIGGRFDTGPATVTSGQWRQQQMTVFGASHVAAAPTVDIGNAFSQCFLTGSSSVQCKASAGNLYVSNVANTTADTWIFFTNSTTAPTNGTLTWGSASGNLVDCFKAPNGISSSLGGSDFPLSNYSVGIYMAASSTACPTLTLSTTATVKAGYK